MMVALPTITMTAAMILVSLPSAAGQNPLVVHGENDTHVNCSTYYQFGERFEDCVPQNEGPLIMEFYPPELFPLFVDKQREVIFNVTLLDPDSEFEVMFVVDNPDLATLVSNFTRMTINAGNVVTPNNENETLADVFAAGNFTNRTSNVFKLQGEFLGRTWVDVLVRNISESNSSFVHLFHYHVAVLRQRPPIQAVFDVFIYVMIIVINFAMGCKTKFERVREVLRRPIAPIIGLCSQYLIMPVTAFAVTRLIDLSPNEAIGFFTLGCSPGGGASNIYTYAFQGDVSLSVTMTLLSTVVSFVMLPFWLFTLGQVVIRGARFTIPFLLLIRTLALMLVPVLVGIFVKWKFPKFTRNFVKYFMPAFVIFVVLFMFSVGVYVNLWIFQSFTPIRIIAGMMLPYIGFILGGLFALMLRQDRKRVITISIETGFQNAGVAIVLMLFSVPPPDGEIAIVAPIASAVLTPVPLWFLLIAYVIYRRHCKKPEDEIPEEEKHLDDIAENGKLPLEAWS